MTTANTMSSPIGEIPAITSCPYCNQPLKLIDIKLDNGRVYRSLPCWGSCGCEASTDKSEYAISSSANRTKQELYRRSGIGDEYQGATENCSEFLNALTAGRNVYITGPNGTGKSMLAALIGMRLIDHGGKVLFVNAAHAEADIKDGFGGVHTDLRARMCSVPVLIIDDLGKGPPTEWSASTWYDVIEERNARNLPIVVTSNYDGGDLIRRLTVNGDSSTARAIVSRLRGGALVKRMSGDDLRLRR